MPRPAKQIEGVYEKNPGSGAICAANEAHRFPQIGLCIFLSISVDIAMICDIPEKCMAVVSSSTDS
jgi:hypothetical protein